MELIVAASAIVISVASLWVSTRAANTQERLLAASVWPHLQYETSDYSFVAPPAQISFNVQNAGVGPARLQWVALFYRGKSYANAQAFFAACCKPTRRINAITEYLQERVLTPNQTVTFIRVPKSVVRRDFWAALDTRRQEAYLRACYCSVLDDCWVFDARQSQPQRVGACPPAPAPLFDG